MTLRFEQLDRQRRMMTWLIGVLLAALCGALMITSWSGDVPMIQLQERWPAMVGLCGLVILFVLYVQYKHRQLGHLEPQLRETAVHAPTMQARFSELRSRLPQAPHARPRPASPAALTCTP